MTETSDPPATSDPARALREFHLDTGTGGATLPADLAPIARTPRPETEPYPILVDSTGDRPTIVSLRSALTSHCLIDTATRVTVDGPTPLREIAALAGNGPDELAAAHHLSDGLVVPLGPGLELHLLDAALASHRAAALRRLEPAARQSLDLLGGLVGHREGDGSADRLGQRLGTLGGQFVDPTRLSTVLGSTSRTDADGTFRDVTSELDALRAAFRELPAPTLVSREESSRPPAGWVLSTNAADPIAAAADAFDRAALSATPAVRALRLARLLRDGRYEAHRHDPWLDRLDWRAFSGDELALAAPIVVSVEAGWLAAEGLGSLSSLLRSGRPVQILVATDPLGQPGADLDDPLGSYRFEPGYLGLSHRETFVAQTTPADPQRLGNALASGVASLRPTLHVHAPVRASDDEGAWQWHADAVTTRAHPVFVYDPTTGRSWARRLDFGGNPAAELDWWSDHDGRVATLADFALLDPEHRGHFREVPAEFSPPELVHLADWLDLMPEQAMSALPFVTAIDAEGRTRPIVVTRRLALAARDRLGFWQTLQELAGVRSEYLDRAAAEARTAAESAAEAEQAALEGRHAEAIATVRAEAVREAADRMTAALLDVDVTMLAATPISGVGPASLVAGTVDEVAERLLGLVTAESLEAGDESSDSDPLTDQLLELVDPASLIPEESPS